MEQKAGQARRDITAFEDSLQPRPLGRDRATVFPSDATSDLYARLGTHTHTHPVDIPTIFQSEHFNLMQRVDSAPPKPLPPPPPPPLLFFFYFLFFSGAVQNVSEMFMRAGAGDKETDRCCLLMVDLSRWQYRTIFGTRESLSHVENVLCFDWRRGKERAASWKR